jgi:hypothetical protein
MRTTRTGLDLSKVNIFQQVSILKKEEEEKKRTIRSSISNNKINMVNSYNTDSLSQSIKPESSSTKIDSASLIQTDVEDETTESSQLNKQTLPITNTSQSQSLNHLTDENEKELARIPYYNGKTNIYAWLIAVKSVFIDLKFDESNWANKAKYYLLDHAAEFIYI